MYYCNKNKCPQRFGSSQVNIQNGEFGYACTNCHRPINCKSMFVKLLPFLLLLFTLPLLYWLFSQRHPSPPKSDMPYRADTIIIFDTNHITKIITETVYVDSSSLIENSCQDCVKDENLSNYVSEIIRNLDSEKLKLEAFISQSNRREAESSFKIIMGYQKSINSEITKASNDLRILSHEVSSRWHDRQYDIKTLKKKVENL